MEKTKSLRTGKPPFFRGKSSLSWSFSIAMLNYQRVITRNFLALSITFVFDHLDQPGPEVIGPAERVKSTVALRRT